MSITSLCSSSQGFPGPFIPERHPSFQRHHAQFKNILPSLRARRNQVLQSSSWHNKHSVCSALFTLQQVQYLGCYFVDQRYLVLTWSWSKHPLLFPWLHPGSREAWLWLPLERAKWVSHTELQWGGCSAAGAQTLPALCGCTVSLDKKDCVECRQKQHHSWLNYPLVI